MSTEILGRVLGSVARVRVMRLFLLNKDKTFLPKDIVSRSRVSQETLRRELTNLYNADFIKKSPKGYYFNQNFPYARELESLLISTDILDEDAIIKEFKKAGKIKLLIVAGIFIKDRDSRVDLLLVGDKLKKSKVEEIIKKLEAEIGVELSYAMFDTKEFLYRLGMYDKLVWDVLDFPHQIVLQARDLSTLALARS